MNEHRRVFVPEDRSPEQRRKSLLRAITALVFARLERASPIKIVERSFPRDPNARAYCPRHLGARRQQQLPASHDYVDAAAARAAMRRAEAVSKRDANRLVRQVQRQGAVDCGACRARFLCSKAARCRSRNTASPAPRSARCKKILIGTAVSSELQSATPGTASAIIGACLARDAEKSLDAVVFGAGAGDAATPTGLLHNVAALPASTDTSTIVAIGHDLGALRQAIANNNIDPSDVIFVTSPKQATARR